MAIYQGDTKISGNAMMVALPMFFATYQPRKLNNPSWLRADPYSWHSADLYVSAYAHLADNISGVTAQTETIAGTTITFYKLSDEIKVVLPDQQTNLDTIYNATGIGYYFVLDTTNRQFKLPRNIYGFTGYRGDVGGYVAPGLPNITGDVVCLRNSSSTGFATGAFYNSQKATTSNGTGSDAQPIVSVAMNASRSSSIYGNSTTVQPPATQAYLYFYVGNTVQNETLADVGEMTEAINDKVDLASSWGFPSHQYVQLTNGASGTEYTAPEDGYATCSVQTTSQSSYFAILNISANFRDGGWTTISTANVQKTIPVKKGDVFRIDYSNATVQYVYFIYAQKTN